MVAHADVRWLRRWCPGRAAGPDQPAGGGVLPPRRPRRQRRRQGRWQLLPSALPLPLPAPGGCPATSHTHAHILHARSGCPCIEAQLLPVSCELYSAGIRETLILHMHALKVALPAIRNDVPVRLTTTVRLTEVSFRLNLCPQGAGVRGGAQVLRLQAAAKAAGFSDVVYLDAVHDRYLEEVSSCNIFTVTGTTIRTPALKAHPPPPPPLPPTRRGLAEPWPAA